MRSATGVTYKGSVRMPPHLPVEIVAAGLPYSKVEELRKLLDLSVEELCRLLPISRRTLSDRKSVV